MHLFDFDNRIFSYYCIGLQSTNATLAITLEALSLYVFNLAGETLCLLSVVLQVLQLRQHITALLPNAEVTKTVRSKTHTHTHTEDNACTAVPLVSDVQV